MKGRQKIIEGYSNSCIVIRQTADNDIEKKKTNEKSPKGKKHNIEK